MKGIVFTEFFEMVEEQLGFELVDKLIDETELKTAGSYTSVGTYDHRELLALVSNLHKFTNIPVNELLENYGQYLFPRLADIAPELINKFENLFDLLLAVDSIIHVEVQKLYPDAELPKFTTASHKDNELKLIYSSCRPFAYLAKGLILGCAQYYDEQVSINIENMHKDTLITVVR
ncbi:heme NO-binding domain-containing protein [Candidatus Colwellia aromaticivorans]|uniref:heme NO-binding domain-containing protein n=1 Tax=Candidatus Colwellia aromaticivorans TaxID=2267621 RepID=UPI000DF1853A|nr:heme NO-binding domain-containing protein [Candidatus Colwellia aromaticivorans]